jgi:hypothetical protein
MVLPHRRQASYDLRVRALDATNGGAGINVYYGHSDVGG